MQENIQNIVIIVRVASITTTHLKLKTSLKILTRLCGK